MDSTEFRNTIKKIFNHISDAAYLENHNLLSFLLSEEEARQPDRMQMLHNKINTAINLLSPPENIPKDAPEWRCHRILTMRYLNMKELYWIEDELGLSQRQVQRDLKKGIDALVSIFWDQYESEKGSFSQTGAAGNEGIDTQELDLIKEELKNWEITFELFNLSQIIDQALRLSKTFLKKDLHHLVDVSGVDTKLDVMVDQILTKQGLYKILAILGSDFIDESLKIQTLAINEFFIELTFEFENIHPVTNGQWEIALLFFTIQGLNHTVVEDKKHVTISITLPLKRQNCCMVIDDVVSVRRLIERMLGSYGIQVFGADQFEEALSLAQLMNPNFILLDVLMPKMDGWQMIEQLKSNAGTKNIPIIICSVLFEPELAKAVGAVGYIRKPINRLELIQTLQEAGLIKVD